MAKTISFTYKDKDYVLEYSRKSIEEMERGGFDITQIDTKPATISTQMFRGAFKKNHPQVSNDRIDEILEKIGGFKKLMISLVDMYNEAVGVLNEETEEENDSDSGKIKWEMK